MPLNYNVLLEMPPSPETDEAKQSFAIPEDSDELMKQQALYTNFFDLVGELKHRIPEEVTDDGVESVRTFLEKVHINKLEWEQFSWFDRKSYTRNLVGHDKNFTVLMLCWDKQQFSAIHDHAGSNCWVKVLAGSAEEERFSFDPVTNAIKSTGKDIAKTGSVSYMHDKLGLHTLGNPSTTEGLVTLHIYSPPIAFCNKYVPDGDGFREESVCMLTVNAKFERYFPLASPLTRLPCITEPKRTLHEFTTFLNEIKLSPPSSDVIKKEFENVKMTQDEWGVLTHFNPNHCQRNVVFFNEAFSIIIICWLKGQKSPKHTHGKGRRSWFKVLTGKLIIKDYDELGAVAKETEALPGMTIEECSGLAPHCVGNYCDEEAVSIHLYTPPYRELQYDEDGQTKVCPAACISKDSCCPPTFDMMFSNFNALVQMLSAELQAKTETDEMEQWSRVMCILERSRFNELEYKGYEKFRRVAGNRIIVHECPQFRVSVNFWERGKQSVIHNHAESVAWIKVLEGTIMEKSYTTCEGAKPVLNRLTHMVPSTVSFLGRGSVHSLCCTSTTDAVTLQVYAPSFNEVDCFTIAEVGKKVKRVLEFQNVSFNAPPTPSPPRSGANTP